MPRIRNAVAGLITLTLTVLPACTTIGQQSSFLNAEPEEGSVLQRSPQTLRLYFAELPDVSRSSLVLEGPDGSLNLRGLHTMGANDLMIEINDRVANGEYTVQWQTYLGENPELQEGSYSFTVQAQ